MDDDKDTRMTSPMNVDATQAPSGLDPSPRPTDDPTHSEGDVKLAPEVMAETRANPMAVEKMEQGTSLAAELRQLEPTAMTGWSPLLPLHTQSGGGSLSNRISIFDFNDRRWWRCFWWCALCRRPSTGSANAGRWLFHFHFPRSSPTTLCRSTHGIRKTQTKPVTLLQSVRKE